MVIQAIIIDIGHCIEWIVYFFFPNTNDRHWTGSLLSIVKFNDLNFWASLILSSLTGWSNCCYKGATSPVPNSVPEFTYDLMQIPSIYLTLKRIINFQNVFQTKRCHKYHIIFFAFSKNDLNAVKWIALDIRIILLWLLLFVCGKLRETKIQNKILDLTWVCAHTDFRFHIKSVKNKLMFIIC